MKRYFFEVVQNGKFSAGSFQAVSTVEAFERVENEKKSGTLTFLQSETGKVLFEKKEDNE
jgi:hypothetical protein